MNTLARHCNDESAPDCAVASLQLSHMPHSSAAVYLLANVASSEAIALQLAIVLSQHWGYACTAKQPPNSSAVA